ncbi:lytic transglycosylase (plasmid) [Azospirillum sp. B510]|uniref:lytic transglycosylase domain-containing protein n=1 Tax=Azospirillum sp. (strain B510) TaxID=137722 RepID=UPI0001C4B997|nr:lytic transglycosylase domain-containing protein [Azospirillum sp. B510]BAI73732.1 lytic transglycosylase [Azospirillum sp. B510]
MRIDLIGLWRRASRRHRAILALATALQTAAAMPAQAEPAPKGIAAVPSQCLDMAAVEWQVPADALRLILAVEQGVPGACSVNRNGTKDCGPGQINSIWFPVIAAGRVPPEVIQQALTVDPCYNIRVTAWILRQEIDKVGWENFWTAVGNYHSRTPEFHARYLRRVIEAAKALSIQQR